MPYSIQPATLRYKNSLGQFQTADCLRGDTAEQTLTEDIIPDTVQTIVFDQTGNVSSITHNRSSIPIRTDVFTFGTNTITEVRTLSSGESLTIVTNTVTLQTTVTYSAG